MAKGKLKLAWIAKDSSRRATFKKRTAGLIKKVSEIATLCDVPACAVVYAPTEAEAPAEDVVVSAWPSAAEATRLLEDFRRSPEMVRCRKMMDRDGFLGQQITKLQDQLRKQAKENHSLETDILMHDALIDVRVASIESVGSLLQAIERTMREVRQRIDPTERAVSTLQALPAVESGNFDYGGAHGDDIMQQYFTNDCVARGPIPSLISTAGAFNYEFGI